MIMMGTNDDTINNNPPLKDNKTVLENAINSVASKGQKRYTLADEVANSTIDSTKKGYKWYDIRRYFKKKEAVKNDNSTINSDKNDDNTRDIINVDDDEYDKKTLTKEEIATIIESEKLYNEGIITIKDMIAPSSVEYSTRDFMLNNM